MVLVSFPEFLVDSIKMAKLGGVYKKGATAVAPLFFIKLICFSVAVVCIAGSAAAYVAIYFEICISSIGMPSSSMNAAFTFGRGWNGGIRTFAPLSSASISSTA